MKQLIVNFLETFATPVNENEPFHFVELIMDNHKCIEFDGVEYYIPEESSLWDDDENLLQEFIIYKFGL